MWPSEGDVPAGDALATLYLFQQLKPKPFVTLLTAMLCEKRICFIASDMDKLTSCTQAALGLLYPFSWQHTFIPVLPASLATFACGPNPIIFGIRRQQLPLLSELPMEDLIYVDLDAGEISWSSSVCPVPDIYILPNTSQVVQAAQKLGAEAAKAAEKLDKAFTKGVAFLQKYTGKKEDDYSLLVCCLYCTSLWICHTLTRCDCLMDATPSFLSFQVNNWLRSLMSQSLMLLIS